VVLKAFSLLWLSRSAEVHNASLRSLRSNNRLELAASLRENVRLRSAACALRGMQEWAG
jgi:hypothetical protein